MSPYSVLLRRPEADRPGVGAALADFFSSGRWWDEFNTAHLWFLYYLALLYAGTLLVLAVGSATAGSGWRSRLTDIVRKLLASPVQPIILAVATLPLMYRMKTWNIDLSTSFVPPLHLLGFYGFFYGFGWLLYHHRDLLGRIAGWWRLYLAAGLGIVLPTLIFLLVPTARAATGQWRVVFDLLGRGLYVLLTWLLVLGVMGLFLRRFGRPNAVVRYVADSAYWLYLVHLPLIMLLNIVVAEWAVAAVIKFAGILLVAVGVLLLSYQVGVRHTIIGRVLNGTRRPEPGQSSTHQGASVALAAASWFPVSGAPEPAKREAGASPENRT